ncbi:MAG: hypothetical protein JWQ40_2789 [Segetibacter sp.]|nr:hypothetical protein [Segetibacter sp.]
MPHHFPLKYTLESGTQVEVNRTAANTYNFVLTTTEGTSDNFMYVEDGRTKDEIEEGLDFDQLNALRAFWLKSEDLM